MGAAAAQSCRGLAAAAAPPGCLRMTATVPSVMLSPMLGTATLMSASAAAEPVMLRASSGASSLPAASAAAAGHCARVPAAAEAPAGRRRQESGGGRRRADTPAPAPLRHSSRHTGSPNPHQGPPARAGPSFPRPLPASQSPGRTLGGCAPLGARHAPTTRRARHKPTLAA